MPCTKLLGKLHTEVLTWEKYFLQRSEEQITMLQKAQNRNVKEIVGHMLGGRKISTQKPQAYELNGEYKTIAIQAMTDDSPRYFQ